LSSLIKSVKSELSTSKTEIPTSGVLAFSTLSRMETSVLCLGEGLLVASSWDKISETSKYRY
jgi:hypothetical protein